MKLRGLPFHGVLHRSSVPTQPKPLAAIPSRAFWSVSICLLIVSAVVGPLAAGYEPAISIENVAERQSDYWPTVQTASPVKSTSPVVTTSPVSASIVAPSAVPAMLTTSGPDSSPSNNAQPFLFGLGAQLGGAVHERLYNEAPVRLITSWFNSSSDLAFMKPWHDAEIPAAYASGRSLHLVVWTNSAESQLTTKYGPACGRTYPLSPAFADDMKQLAQIYQGNGPLYVSMFSEFQTYPCKDNNWNGSENYYRALKDQYVLAQSIFATYAPNAKLALSWGGWQSAWDDPSQGGGRSLLPHFADVMNSSGFQSFQAMDSNSNVQSIIDMTHLLHGYGTGAVMVAHYKPDNGSQLTWRRDLNDVFQPSVMNGLQRDGLFAFSFMDEKNINASEADYQKARAIVTTYAR